MQLHVAHELDAVAVVMRDAESGAPGSARNIANWALTLAEVLLLGIGNWVLLSASCVWTTCVPRPQPEKTT